MSDKLYLAAGEIRDNAEKILSIFSAEVSAFKEKITYLENQKACDLAALERSQKRIEELEIGISDIQSHVQELHKENFDLKAQLGEWRQKYKNAFDFEELKSELEQKQRRIIDLENEGVTLRDFIVSLGDILTRYGFHVVPNDVD